MVSYTGHVGQHAAQYTQHCSLGKNILSITHSYHFIKMVDTVVLQRVHKSSYPASHIGENCLLSLHPDGIQRSGMVSTLWGVTQEANHVVQTRALSVILVANRGDSPSTVAVTGKTPTGIGSSKAMKAVLAQKMRSDEMYVRKYISVHVLRTVYTRPCAVHNNVP